MSVTLTLTDPGYCEDLKESHKRVNDTVSDGQDIQNARESELILFDNTTQGLGLKVCGGFSQDGKEEYGIFIKRVLPGGLAEARGDDLQYGDLILEVNGQSMHGITYDRAVSILRQASASNHVEMIITRDVESRKEFAEFQSKYGTESNTRKTSNNFSETGADFSKNDTVYKNAGLDLSDSLDQCELKLNLSGLSTNTNGHISPTSSHSSEVANHLMDGSNSARQLNHSLTTIGPAADRDTPIDALDSLLSKKLIKDPNLKWNIDQLEAALSKLGLELTPQKHQILRESLTVDADGTVRFEEFAKIIKTMFRGEMGALKGRMTPLAPHVTGYSQQGATVPFIGNDSNMDDIIKERDALRVEVAALKDELRTRNSSSKQSEEQLLFIRKQAQSVIEEGRTLRTKLHLAEQAQVRAQQTERDYEEVVAMLENEVAQLRLQGAKSDTLSMQKRLAVLVCQLKKAESGIKTYEVATEKLVKHIEYSLEVLSSLEKSPRVGDATKAKAQKKKAMSSLATEGRDVIKLARSLMETIALPFGWEEAYTSEGVRYYINHLNQTTTWTHPVSCMEHQTNAKTSSPRYSQPQNDESNPTVQVSDTSQPPQPPPIAPPAPDTNSQPPPPQQPPFAQSQQQHRPHQSQQSQNVPQHQEKHKKTPNIESSNEFTKKHSPRKSGHKESGLI